jgi:hypothetical protein
MNAPSQPAQHPDALLTIVVARVRLEKSRLEIELSCEFKRQPALSDVAFVLCRIEADFYAYLLCAQ